MNTAADTPGTPEYRAARILDAAAGIIARINAADRAAKAAEHTDTGALWDALAEIRADALTIKRHARLLGAPAPARPLPKQEPLDL